MDQHSLSAGELDEFNVLHGFGHWQFGGWEYHGQWEHGTPRGEGTLLYRKNDKLVFTYTGGIDELCQHGYGRQEWYGDGASIIAIYEGEWKRGFIVDETKWDIIPDFFHDSQLSQEERFIFCAVTDSCNSILKKRG